METELFEFFRSGIGSLAKAGLRWLTRPPQNHNFADKMIVMYFVSIKYTMSVD